MYMYTYDFIYLSWPHKNIFDSQHKTTIYISYERAFNLLQNDP